MMAARHKDTDPCPMVTGLVPLIGGPIPMGCAAVMIGAWIPPTPNRFP